VGQAVVPAVQGPCGAVVVVRPGLQPGQLSSATGTAQANPELEAEDAAREVGQDWCQGGIARQVRRVPVGGGSRAPSGVRGDSETDRPAAAGVCLGVNSAAAANACPNLVVECPERVGWVNLSVFGPAALVRRQRREPSAGDRRIDAAGKTLLAAFRGG